MTIRYRLLVAALVAMWMVAPTATTSVSARSSHVCDTLCGDGASCNQECWRTQFDYDQDYPSTTCGAEGFECCGDGTCNPLTEGCNVCTDDCGWTSSCNIECTGNAHCGSGEVCTAARECVISTPTQSPPSPHQTCGGTCSSANDCCGNDVCVGPAGGQKNCAIPQSTYCTNSPSCSSNWECDFSVECLALYNQDSAVMYCDPGIDRCQYVSGTGCPDASNGSVCTI